MSVFDTTTESTRSEALEAAASAVRDGKLIVLPTDTVYGIGADAFSPEAVEDLRDAKGRGRDMPPPVLIGDQAVLMALAVDMPDYVEDLADAFWPGPLTIILTAQPSLSWDLGETRGTVALRMPDDEVALELLRTTGPLAVSSANRTGKSAALTVLDAATQLGDAVEVYLDGGNAPIGESSTIIDATVTPPEIVRQGALSREDIVEKVGDIFTPPPAEEEPEAPSEESAPPADAESAGTQETGAQQVSTEDPSSGTDIEPTATDDPAPAAETTDDSPTGDDIPGEGTSGDTLAATSATSSPDDAGAVSGLRLPREAEASPDRAEDAPGAAAG